MNVLLQSVPAVKVEGIAEFSGSHWKGGVRCEAKFSSTADLRKEKLSRFFKVVEGILKVELRFHC